MKIKIIYILLFPFLCNAQVNVDSSPYNATGNGTTDDTSAIQAAFDTGQQVTFGSGKTYRITSGLDLDVSGNQTIVGNNASIIATSGGSYIADHAISINKSSGIATINNLTINGNYKFRYGLELLSDFSLNYVTVTKIGAINGEKVGVIGISIPNFGNHSYSLMYMNHVTVDDVDSTSDGNIASGIEGVAKGLQVIGNGSPTVHNNNLLIENSTFKNVWGDDADAVDIFLIDGHPEFTGSVIFNNVTVENAGRRVMKSRISRSTFNNCTFSVVKPGNPRMYSSTYLNSLIAHFNFGSDPDLLRDVTYNNCTFNGSTLEDKISIYETTDITFKNCTFNRVRIALTDYWGDVYLLGNYFDANSSIISYNVNDGWEPGTGLADCDNTKINPSWDAITATPYTSLPCPPGPISKLIGGDILFTAKQKVALQSRYDATSGKYISDMSGWNGDWNEIKADATAFYSDMSDDVYSGRWDNFLSGSGDLTSGVSGTDAANAEPVPTKGVTNKIHAAAIDIQFTGTDKAGKSLKVFKAILSMAKDDKLDWGNGSGANNPNATYGTNERFLRSYTGDGNPWFLSADYIANLMEDYSLIAPYLVGNGYYIANYKRVEDWFYDVASWYKNLINNRTKAVLHSNWRNEVYSNYTTLAYQGVFAGAQGATYYDASGNQYNNVTWKQSSGVNNRSFSFAVIVYTYGMLFDVKDYRDFGFDFFKAWLQCGVFPDGTLAEWYRSYDGNPNQGFTYNFITIGYAVKISQMWAVAVQNKIPGITDKGKFYDYTTNKGIETTYSGYTSITNGTVNATATGGTNKTLYKVLINWSKFFRSSASGGYKGIRKAENLVNYNGDNRTMMDVSQAVANTYYKTTALTEFTQFNGTGYDAKLGGGDTPPSGSALSNGPWGFDWSVGAFGIFQARTGSYADLMDVFDGEFIPPDPPSYKNSSKKKSISDPFSF